MHQSTTPPMSQTIWPRWASRQFFQPPYSLDPAPCDFWLFPKLKERLRGCRHKTIEEMKEAVTKVIDTLHSPDFQKLKMIFRCSLVSDPKHPPLFFFFVESTHQQKMLLVYFKPRRQGHNKLIHFLYLSLPAVINADHTWPINLF